MGRTFINDLYYGRITPWERRRARKSAYTELDGKIICEREQFTKRLSEEDLQNFEKLEELCMTRQEQEKIESFRQGLKIGAFFMEEIYREGDL